MKKTVKFLVLILCLIFPIKTLASSSDEVLFSKCIDGDTAKFILNNEEIKVRFLAIDTPETKHPKKGSEFYGKEASDYTCKKIKNANKIVLEYDINSDKKDKYGRYLAWVFVDNTLLQEELVEKGYAKVSYLYGDYKYTNKLQNKEKEAKHKKLGIWDNNKDGLETKYKVIITILFVVIIIVYLYYDKKTREKVIRKGKSKIKKQLKKEIRKRKF